MDYPSRLFKYQKFKEYSKSMLETGFIYFCPAIELDDLFECAVSVAKEILEGDEQKYVKNLLPFIENLLRPYKKHEIDDSKIINCYDNGVLDSNKFKKIVRENDSSIDDDTLNKGLDFIKQCEDIEEQFPQFKDSFENLYKLASFIGIYSLSEEYNNQVMWAMYADNNKGFCIEYDIGKYFIENPSMIKNLRIVEYTDRRNNDPIKILLEYLYSSIFKTLGLSTNEYDVKEVLTQIACCKNTDWSFQKEWRFIGNPKQEGVYIPIKAVYLGKKIDAEIKNTILEIAKEKGFKVFQQEMNSETTDFEYRKVL